MAREDVAADVRRLLDEVSHTDLTPTTKLVYIAMKLGLVSDDVDNFPRAADLARLLGVTTVSVYRAYNRISALDVTNGELLEGQCTTDGTD